jgi:hypothetical protein
VLHRVQHRVLEVLTRKRGVLLPVLHGVLQVLQVPQVPNQTPGTRSAP